MEGTIEAGSTLHSAHIAGKSVPYAYEKKSPIEILSSPSNSPRSDGPLGFCNPSSWRDKLVQAKSFREGIFDIDTEAESPKPWKTTFLRLAPLSGIASMILALTSIAVALAILAGSNTQVVESWAVPPSTYLAILTAIANSSMRYAAFQGVVIAWWYRAMFQDSTLARLHWVGELAQHLLACAFHSGRRLGMVGLACICSTLVVIDGPLLQRSTSVVPADIPVLLNVSMAAEIPTGYTGEWARLPGYRYGPSFNDTFPTPDGRASNFITATLSKWVPSLALQWYNDYPLEKAVRGCPGSCKAKLNAPALFAIACRSQVVTSAFKTPFNWDKVAASLIAPPLENVAFIIEPTLVLGQHEAINLITAYYTGTGTGRDCTGSLNLTTCTLEAGIGEYAFTLQNGHATIDPDSALRPNLVALSNNTAVNYTKIRKSPVCSYTLGGVVEALRERYAQSVFYLPSVDHTYVSFGVSLFQEYFDESTIEETCPSHLDPFPDVLRAANKLMVHFGAWAASLADSTIDDINAEYDIAVEHSYKTTAVGSSQGHNVFHSNYWFFLGAALVELVCIALVAPTYWGWWKLGRAVSFSPLEMAKAFESPLLAECNSNSSGRDLAYTTGDKAVRYGLSQQTKLAFGDPAFTDHPQAGVLFDKKST